MRKNSKKALSLLLAVILVVGMLPVSAFAADSDFTIEDGVLTDYNGPDGEVTIPEGVTSIGDRAFAGSMALTSVTIPDSVTSIGSYAFGYCSNLTSVTIPASVTSMGKEPFYGCDGLTSAGPLGGSYDLQFGWTKDLPEHAFSGFSYLTSITIPDSVTSIGSGAFSGCSGLTSITIPNAVTSIGNYAFSGCSSLTGMTIPNSVTSIWKLCVF